VIFTTQKKKEKIAHVFNSCLFLCALPNKILIDVRIEGLGRFIFDSFDDSHDQNYLFNVKPLFFLYNYATSESA
jgi:hypothetical protein